MKNIATDAKFDVFSNKFSHDIFLQKYSKDKQETWLDNSKRVIRSVTQGLLPPVVQNSLLESQASRQFIPAGRYLYAAGRDLHQVNNCFLFRATDSREGWARILHDVSTSLMTGGGIGVDYSDVRAKGSLIKRTGGEATGPCSLMQMVNESGRHIMQGGQRRCLSEDTQVTMADGKKKYIKDVEIGERVATRFGPRKVTNKFYQGKQETMTIVTTYGILECTPRHKWLTLGPNSEKIWVRAAELTDQNVLFYHPYKRSDEGKIALDHTKAYDLGVNIAKNIMKKQVVGLSGLHSYKFDTLSIILANVLNICLEDRYEVWHINHPSQALLDELQSLFSHLGIHTEVTKDALEFSPYQKPLICQILGHHMSSPLPPVRKDTAEIHAPIRKIGKGRTVATWDIEVEEVHEFIADNHVSHNSAIWAGLSWWHPDIYEFLDLKDYSQKLRDCKEEDFNFPLPMELTNISVIYETFFFDIMDGKKPECPEHVKKIWGMTGKPLPDFTTWAKDVWHKNCKQAFKKAEPGMSFNYLRDKESLRNAPVTAQTKVLTTSGYRTVGDIVGKNVEVWTGKQYAFTTFKKTKVNSDLIKVTLSNGRSITCSPEHPFIAKHYIGKGRKKKIELERIAAEDLEIGQKISSDLPQDWEKRDIYLDDEDNFQEYGLGFVFGDGSIRNHKGDISYHHETKRKCFAQACKGLNAKTGTHLNRAYFNCDMVENKHQLLNRTRELSPFFIAGWFDADGCHTRNLLRLSCKDKEDLQMLQESLDFYGIKSTVRPDGYSSYKPENRMYTLQILSSSLLRFKELIPTLRVKVTLPDTYIPYRESEIIVTDVEKLDHKEDVYCCDVGVEEHSFMAEGVIISNCTEVTSEDDSDKCNLGTSWLNHCNTVDEFTDSLKHGTQFLLCGGIYSHVPTERIREIGQQNNRIGFGIGGIHEWLMSKDSNYEVTPDLHQWLKLYEEITMQTAYTVSKELGVNLPKGLRAIAPNGTIGILAETTTGIEPLFCKAYKRRYFEKGHWHSQYVVDGCVKRLLQKGIPLDHIKDSFDISFEERVKFQADIQDYVDMAISSTCNMPAWGSDSNNDSTVRTNADILYRYAKRLRGFTCYPDGSRGGQPLTRVPLEEALGNEGTIFTETEDQCLNGVCGV